MRPEGDEIRQVADRRKFDLTKKFHRHTALEHRQIQFGALHETRQVGHRQDDFIFQAADKNQNPPICGIKKLGGAPAESTETLAQCNQPLHPPQKRAQIFLLGIHVDRFVMMLRVDDDREKQPLRVGMREARVAIGAPLHRRAHAVPIAKVKIIAHANLITVINDGSSRQGKEQAVEQLDFSAVVAHQRRKTPTDAEIDPRLRVAGINLVHIVAVFVGHHFQSELIMVA